ncbi:MAG: DUF2007 domain-containing protein [Phycisphaerales bacterium]|nr:DUF2007 domain-containing protein [Hyphomonadaceae bacterium]
MRQAYLPANAAEAHMLAHLLSEEGIIAHLHGEALQGAAGELPAGGTLQVLVADEDYDRARALLLNWERQSGPSDAVAQPGKRFRFVAALVFLAVGVVAGWALKVALDNSRFTIAETSESLDQNGDGRDDFTWSYRLGSSLAYKAEQDSNFDGQIDVISIYDEVGVPIDEQSDRNFDGVFETRSEFRHGIRIRNLVDTDSNEVPDATQFFEGGVLVREEMLDHRYGHVARIDHYGPYRLERSEVDLDRDGFLETLRVYDRFGEIERTEQRTPNL